ncbi:MAG: radical SAM family heme chaperone HemW, partial [Firmicutes bacterium]|nr:radical SAM family heme chaperone HemW [Bacillota bacterium]
ACYGRLLHSEAALWRERAQIGPLKSVYLGGGTPSLLPGEDVVKLLAGFAYTENVEITLEANPESVNREKLDLWRAAGVNRLSLGAQSFDNGLLQAMGRPHTAAQIAETVLMARAAGFSNISVDLIYGLPGQGLGVWRADLALALALGVEHISLYGLSLSADSPWGRAAAEDKLQIADADISADMLEAALDILTKAGYTHYEISNFAKAGYESRHNTAYWLRENYLGLGAAAASCAGEKRWFNQRELATYQKELQAGRLPQIEEERLSIEEVLSEALFLGLRLVRGVNLEEYAFRYGTRPEHYYKKPLRRLERQGLVEIVQGHLRLTQRGILLGNEVFMQFV